MRGANDDGEPAPARFAARVIPMEVDVERIPKPVPEPVGVPPPNGVLVVLSNAPDAERARAIARTLVDERLAACVNVLAPCHSVYRWQGEVESADEVPLLIKTTQDRFAALARRFRELHPYEVPELIAFKPDAGLPAYLDWVIGQTRPARGAPRR